LARTVIGEVIEVDAEGDIGGTATVLTSASPPGTGLARHRGQATYQLVLAVPAPVATVGPVLGPIGFPGLHLAVVEAPFPGQGAAIVELRLGQ
jgi:hypothetical protein